MTLDPLAIADIPASASVTNQSSSVLQVNGLADIAGSATVTITFSGLKEARRLRRWQTVKSAIAGGALAFAAPNALWGTIRVKNLTASAINLDRYGIIAASDTVDIATGNMSIANRFRVWKSVQNAVAGSVLSLIDTTGAETAGVTSITPNTSDTASGKAVTISGDGFLPGAAVTIGGVSATSIVVVNESTITAVTPTHAAGAVNVVVTNPGSSAGTLVNGFTYTAATFTSITPDNGAAAGGTAVTIAGTHFEVGVVVTIGGVAVTSPVRVSSTSFTCVTGAHSAVAVNVVITNPGTGGSVATGTAAYTYT